MKGKKREQYIKELDNFNNKYFNDDQKRIIKKLLELAPEKEIDTFARFLFMKRTVGFGFDYSPEIAKGRIILLEEDKKRRINVSEEVTGDENKLIIGDNYNALQSLLCTDKGKIDVIYIDPPYNTIRSAFEGNQSSKEKIGKNSLIYKDKFGRNGWLTMMVDRLYKAKELLSDDGVIFVSINDYEQAYLKVAMDNIFGEDNFIGTIVWLNGVALTGTVNMQRNHEYVHVYSKNSKKGLLTSKIKIDKNDIHIDEKGNKYIITSKLLSQNTLSFRCNQGTSIYYRKNDKSFILKDDYNKEKAKISDDYHEIYEKPDQQLLSDNFKIIRPIKPNGIPGRWGHSKEGLEKLLKDNRILIKEDKNGNLIPFMIKYIHDDFKHYGNIKSIIQGFPAPAGARELKTIFNDDVFDYPKASKWIKHVISSYYRKDITILDFFAGSGTTGQAVMQLNREDGGKRKFILCTNNENNIAHSVTYERLNRIIKGKGTRGETNFKWLEKNQPFSDAKLRVLDITTINIETNTKDIDAIIKKAEKGLKLLNSEYTKKGLDLYYDLAALNPLNEDNEK